MGVSGQRYAPVVLYLQGKDPRYALHRRLWKEVSVGYLKVLCRYFPERVMETSGKP
jgi:hypothetical protein